MDVIIDVPDNEEKQSKTSVIPTVFGITIAMILVFIAIALYCYVERPTGIIATYMDMLFIEWLGYLPFL